MTIKISGLIELLEQRMKTHGDAEVRVTWEGVFREIRPENVYRSKGEGPNGEIELLIDADKNFYKEKFAEDPTEGETQQMRAPCPHCRAKGPHVFDLRCDDVEEQMYCDTCGNPIPRTGE